MKKSSKAELVQQQIRWATSEGLAVDSRGYLDNVDSNLLKPLSPMAKQAFTEGGGSELLDTTSRPAKMKALHSSSALAVNVFDSWTDSDKTDLAQALEIEEAITSLAFEKKFSTGLGGTPPTLDVALELSSGHVIGIESKFSEWLTHKSKSKPPFKDKYFQSNEPLWGKHRLPQSQKLAKKMFDGRESFRYLDAPQLLKHALGLATQCKDRFSLYYIYYDWPGYESDIHQEELHLFSEYVAAELRFKSLSYQELFQALDILSAKDGEYSNYLRSI